MVDNPLRYDIADARMIYDGRFEPIVFSNDKLSTFNLRHKEVFRFYGLELAEATVYKIDDRVNGRSNLGVFRSKQLREGVVLAAALPAVSVMIHGFGSLQKIEKDQQSKKMVNRLKRYNDRCAAQVMSEVLQLTTESFQRGEEVVIESAITEGVRVKPGVEVGGNPTIPVGALFGKEEHCNRYGRGLGEEISMLSMGSDVIDGTGKTIKGTHSALTALFITESGFKRHLPDIYVERWMAGAPFKEFNPRDTDLKEEARIIADACGIDFSDLTAFFLDRPRHYTAMDRLNKIGLRRLSTRMGICFQLWSWAWTGSNSPTEEGCTA